jgi:hypothetical protein
MRYKRRRDANDSEIGQALTAAGFTVHDFAGAGYVPDRLITRPLPDERLWVCWVEIKVKDGKLRPSQEKFAEIFEPRGEFYVARDPKIAVIELIGRWLEACGPQEG